MKKFIKFLLINPDLFISLLIYLPLFYLIGEFFITLIIYLISCLILGPLTYNLIYLLESKYEVLDSKNLKNPVLILGGGHDTIEKLAFNQQLTLGALGRVIEGLRLFHASKTKTLILSGPSLAENFPSQAEIQAKMLSEISEIRNVNILKLNTPRTTEEEAESYAKAMGSISPILVTKAIHMHRAVFTFNNIGIQVIPAPCNFIIKKKKHTWINWLLPAFSQSHHLGELLKEAFGLMHLVIKAKLTSKPLLSKV